MSKKILIVDDQAIERSALRGILAAEPSWQVHEAIDGEDALHMLRAGFRPQLCVVDVQMPRVDGVEFLRRVRDDPELRELRVVIASGIRDRNTVVELAKLSIAGYLLKPFESDRILAVLRPILATIPDPGAELVGARNLLAKIALVADDDGVARAALSTIIKEEPYWEVTEVGDGRAALQQLQTGLRPDLCFIDLQMPEMDGVALIAEIRRNPRWQDVRVAVVSGARDREQIVRLGQLHIDTYLLKPLDPVKVRAALRACA